MLYYFFKYLDQVLNLPGAGVFKYISFRGSAAAVLSLLISIVFGKYLIKYLQRKHINEGIREGLCLKGQEEKKYTPSMGGILIIAATVTPTLLFARLDNVYILLLLISTVWMGTIGFLDDYIKVFKKKRDGLEGRFKLLGQCGLGIIVGATLYFHQGVVVREFDEGAKITYKESVAPQQYKDVKSTKTSIPFFKNNELDYKKVVGSILPFLPDGSMWFVYIVIVTFIIAAVSNGANLTDGLDGLASGTSASAALTLGILAYVSGNVIASQYLNIMYIPGSGELAIFCSAFVGACLGFLWYNAYPAEIFMGDTGSLTIGGVIAVLALTIRKELLIPLLCGVFLIENLSVILQVSYFKYTKRKTGQGVRLLKMAPLHHHFQKMNIHEAKIVARFWLISILLAILTLVTLKLR